MATKWRLIIISLLVTLLCFYLSTELYQSYHPLGALDLKTEKSELLKKSKSMAQSLSISMDSLYPELELSRNRWLIHQIYDIYGLKQGNQLLRDQVPGYFWEIHWKPEKSDQTINIFDGQKAEGMPDSLKNSLENIRFRYDMHGDLIGYTLEIPDTIRLSNIDYSTAKQSAIRFINQYTTFKDIQVEQLVEDKIASEPDISGPEIEGTDTEQTSLNDRHTSYDFKWTISNDLTESNVDVKITVTGQQVSAFSTTYVIPEIYRDNSEDVILSAMEGIITLLFVLICLIYAFKKSRTYELRFQYAVILGIIVAILNAFSIFLVFGRMEGSGFFISLLIGPVLIGGAYIVAWAVSESLARETWKEKLIPFDLLMKGHLIHSKIGAAILRGIPLGVLALLIFLFLLWVVSRFTHLSVYTSNQIIPELYVAANPAAHLISGSLWPNFYILAINCMLVLSILSQRIQRGGWIILIAAIPLGIMLDIKIQPLPIGIIINILAVIILIWSFYRYEVLTTFIALLTFKVVNVGLSFQFAGLAFLQNSALILITLFGLIIIYAIISLNTKDTVSDYKQIEPALAKYINERQRLQQELKVARDVQMSFLPQHVPVLKGLEMASKCSPALEVGGDYFDFIKIDASKVGVVIGDVSGKGTRAAFYMTLVKGFLKALSRSSISPSGILKELNTLFFENAKRDAFISMVIGFFDLEQHKLTLARSGHNPVIFYRANDSQLQIIKTDGLALGLEKGALFDKMMQEVEINFYSGDIFVFYTDGLTEAMNKNNEEFGEQRLLNVIKNCSPLPAETILNKIYREVTKFSHGTEQHDDMSAVVVKITS